MIQLSILKISGYGPWTLTLGSDREHELQMLQASMYGEIQRLFSERNCLAFLNRADEFFVVSNGIALAEHVDIQRSLEKSFDVHLTMSIGCGESPFQANLAAYRARMNDAALDRKHRIFGSVNGDAQNVSIMHLDVDGLTSRGRTDSPYEITSAVFGLYSKMSDFFLARGSLAFFLGGDNFMVVASDAARDSVRQFIKAVRDDDGILLNCGIGCGRTGREAAGLATKSLDTIREIRDSGGSKPEVYEMSC